MSSVELQTIPGEKQDEEYMEQQQQEQQQQKSTIKPVTVNGVEGKVNPGFEQEQEESEMSLPPMTFVDFLPLLLEEAASVDDIPRYAEFR